MNVNSCKGLWEGRTTAVIHFRCGNRLQRLDETRESDSIWVEYSQEMSRLDLSVLWGPGKARCTFQSGKNATCSRCVSRSGPSGLLRLSSRAQPPPSWGYLVGPPGVPRACPFPKLPAPWLPSAALPGCSSTSSVSQAGSASLSPCLGPVPWGPAVVHRCSCSLGMTLFSPGSLRNHGVHLCLLS